MVANAFNLSLFELLQENLSDSIPLIRASKATLVHISHALEDVVLSNAIPAMIFTGFQESSHWKEETERYRQLADVATQVCIFAGKPLPPESNANQLHVELTGDDPLRQEWFLIILSDAFSVLLCGQDRYTPALDESNREFDTFWTFDPTTLNPVLDLLEGAVRQYRPDRLEALQVARRTYNLSAPDPVLITQLTANLLAYEERLNREMGWQQSLVDTLLSTINPHLYVEEINAEGAFNIIYESPNVAHILGEEFNSMARAGTFESRVHPDNQAAYNRHLDALRQGKDSRLEFRFLRGDNTLIWLRDIAQVKVGVNSVNDETLRRVYGVLDDITEQKAMEAARREQEQLQLDLERERQFSIIRNYFMTTVSHEFRTPLATIYSASEILSRYHERISTEDRLKKLDSIQSQVQHITDMLNSITRMLDEQIGHVVSEPVPVRLADYLNNIIRAFQGEHPTGHDIVLRYESNTSPMVNAQPHLVRTILENLLSNAVKYSDADQQIQVSIRVEAYDIYIQVIDEGIGIPQADHAEVFMPFHRGSNTHNIPGVGLGLDIVRTCVELHDGSISFESAEGEGTTFNVKLGISPAEPPIGD